ncbi:MULTISPECIES: alpha/beta hydrolase [unclassified Exiguobacterium]|uniref:alpha/beta hydrolase n=1 Tax=unclassified Exiguobacterium TaxID=2644629 RepID=UPI001BE84ED6|nr:MULTISPECIES: alpha/beta hydrolase [unclassified Exiguobacterium]MDE0564010.1 alpha/beta hydrolase [Exiguobacterium sp. B2(2022)]
MKKFFKWAALSIVGLLVVAVAGFLIWTQFTYGPTDEATQYAEEGKVVDNRLEFGDTTSEVGVILYPGAKVEKEAYAYYGTRLAEEGVFVAIPSLRLNLGILDIDAAAPIIEAHPEIERWIVAGHSLGGSAASGYALEHQELVEGVIFLASYPISSMVDSDLRVLSISGELDGLAVPEDIEASRSDLPEDSQFVQIEGGNHANFGMYGPQKGDQESPLTSKEQLDEVLSAILEWL